MKPRSRSLPAMTQNIPCDTTQTSRRASLPSQPEHEVAGSSDPSSNEFSAANDNHDEPVLNADITQEDIRLRYQCLPDASRYIRLLKFQPPQNDASDSVDIHCVLENFSLDEAPAYIAISYTWGEPTPTATIYVDGFSTDVGLNCEAVLRRAHAYNPSSFYWIDAVCIDQKNLDEKGMQVALMGQLFRGSRRVLAYVGDHADDSEFLYATIRSEKFFDRLGHLSLFDICFRLEVAFRFAFKSKKTLLRLCKAQAAFSQRDYFKRLWVYQELASGRKVNIHCGGEYLPIRTLYGSVSVISSWTSSYKSSNAFLFFSPDLLTLGHDISSSDAMFEVGTNGARTHTSELVRHVLQSRLNCRDRLDKIYGILSMIDWGNHQPIQPDYSRDRFDLAVETLTKSNNNYSFSYFTLASDLATLLELRPGMDPSANLMKAIRQRQEPISQQDPGTPTPSVSRSARVFFKGAQLALDNKGRLVFQMLDNALKGVVKRTVTPWRQPTIHRGPIEGMTSQMLFKTQPVVLPQAANAGDWCLFNKFYSNKVFVVRGYNQGRHFRIVGQGCIGFRSFEGIQSSFWRGFIVYLGAEDVVIDAATCPDSLYMSKSSDVEKFVGSGYSGNPWSSYAELVQNNGIEIDEGDIYTAP